MIKVKEHTISPILHAQAGDVLDQDGNTVQLKRSGAVVATATIGAPIAIQSGEITTKRVISSVFVAEEIKMGLSLTVQDVIHLPDGSKQINFPNGSGITVQSTDFDNAIEAVNGDDWKITLLLARMKMKSPDLSSDASISGYTLEVHPDSDLRLVDFGAL